MTEDVYDYYDQYYYDESEDTKALEKQFANLTSQQWNIIHNYTLEGQKCMLDFWTSPPLEGE